VDTAPTVRFLCSTLSVDNSIKIVSAFQLV
jgi:hypothetical protein